MDAFLDHWGPRIVRWMGTAIVVVCSALVAVCLAGFLATGGLAWLALAAGDGFLVFIGWTVASDGGDR